jgi:hypothetical protein
VWAVIGFPGSPPVHSLVIVKADFIGCCSWRTLLSQVMRSAHSSLYEIANIENFDAASLRIRVKIFKHKALLESTENHGDLFLLMPAPQ